MSEYFPQPLSITDARNLIDSQSGVLIPEYSDVFAGTKCFQLDNGMVLFVNWENEHAEYFNSRAAADEALTANDDDHDDDTCGRHFLEELTTIDETFLAKVNEKIAYIGTLIGDQHDGVVGSVEFGRKLDRYMANHQKEIETPEFFEALIAYVGETFRAFKDDAWTWEMRFRDGAWEPWLINGSKEFAPFDNAYVAIYEFDEIVGEHRRHLGGQCAVALMGTGSSF